MAKPKIRFKGYTDDWEQRKLGDVLVSLQNNTLSRADLSNEAGVAKNVHYGDVLIKFGEVLDVSKEQLPMISDESILTKYKTSFLQNGDVIIADTAEDTTVGKCSEIVGLNDEVVLSGLHTIPYRPVEKFAPKYLGYYLNSDAYHNQLLPLMQGIKVTSISKSAMQDTDIIYPKSKEEQTEIGNYFDALDHLITLHQCKCHLLHKLLHNDWEQRKFSEFVKNVAVRNKAGVELECYAVTNDRGFISQKEAHDAFGYMADADTTAYNIVPPSSFAYNPARINVGSIGYYTGIENVIVSSLYEVFQTADYVDDRFMWHWFKSDHFSKWIERLQEGSVRLYFYYDKLIQCEMKMPSLEEQKKMGAFFDQLDHLITLHQRKCEETKKLKKYMLQKMFPQNGQKVPEIRFSGFTDAWEQRKLGEVLDDMYNGQTPSRKRDEYWNGNIRWLSSGELNRGIVYSSIETITEEGKKSANLRVVPKGTFVMAITGLEASGTRGNCALLGFDTTLNQSCMALFPKQDILISQFLFQWYRMVGEEYGINYTQGTKQQSYNAELIKILPILLPSIDEQKKIASYLNSIDHLITLHQHKCEQLQSMKKFMLQNMFV